jgi:hypothetical protein
MSLIRSRYGARPDVITYMLNAPQSLDVLERMKTGISDSGLNLTQSKFLELSIPKFSLLDQREIVRQIEMAFSWINRLASEATNARGLIDHLDRAVLAKAFRGELVPQMACIHSRAISSNWLRSSGDRLSSFASFTQSRAYFSNSSAVSDDMAQPSKRVPFSKRYNAICGAEFQI